MTLHDIFVKSFGISREEFYKIQGVQSKEELEKVLENLKRLAKVSWKKKAMELHPDRGGDAEEMKKLNALWNRAKGLKVLVRPRPQPVTFVTVHYSSSSGFYGGGGVTTGWTGTYSTGNYW